jgi:hypothetical protein
MPARLLHGRVRTSTVLLTLVFLVALVTYLLVRPVPASVAGTSPPSTAGPTSAGSAAVAPGTPVTRAGTVPRT